MQSTIKMKTGITKTQRGARVMPEDQDAVPKPWTFPFIQKPISLPFFRNQSSGKYHPDIAIVAGSASSLHEIHPFTLKFKEKEIEMAYQHSQQQVFITFDGFKAVFAFSWVYALCEVIFNALVEQKIRYLYICVTIFCFISAHVVPSYAKTPDESSMVKQGKLRILYIAFALFCIPVLIFGRNTFENEYSYGLAVGTFIANIAVIGLIFSMDFPLILVCTLSQTATAMMCFAQESVKWLPEQSRICLAFSIFLVCCLRIVILQGRNTFGLLQSQKLKVVEQTTSAMLQIANDAETPMCNMSFALECFEFSTTEKEKVELLKVISGGVKVLTILYDEARAIFYQSRGQERTPSLQDVDIKELVQNVLWLNSSFSAFGRKNLQIFVDAKLPSVISTDGRLLYMMFYNLLSNATEFTKDGVIRVFIYHWKYFIRVEVECEGIEVFELEEELVLKQILQLENDKKKIRLKLFGVAMNARALDGDFGMYTNLCGSGSVSWFEIPLVLQQKKGKTSMLSKKGAWEKVVPFPCPGTQLESTLIFLGNWSVSCQTVIHQEFKSHPSLIFWAPSLEAHFRSNIPILTKRKTTLLCWRIDFSEVTIDTIVAISQDFLMVFLLPISNGDVNVNLEQVKNHCAEVKNRSSSMMFLLDPSVDEREVVHALRSKMWLSEMQIRDYRCDVFANFIPVIESRPDSLSSSLRVSEFLHKEDSKMEVKTEFPLSDEETFPRDFLEPAEVSSPSNEPK